MSSDKLTRWGHKQCYKAPWPCGDLFNILYKSNEDLKYAKEVVQVLSRIQQKQDLEDGTIWEPGNLVPLLRIAVQLIQHQETRS